MIKLGDKVTINKSFPQEEVNYYANLSQDSNPIHFDENYAKKTIFKKPIVHGLLVASLFGGLLGTKLPGKGTIHLGQDLKFLKPVFVNENIKATIEVINIRDDKPIITFSCLIEKNNGQIAIEGKAVVLYKEPMF